MRLLLRGFLLLVQFSVFANGHDHPSLKELQSTYPTEKAVFINRSEHLNVKVSWGKLKVYEEAKEEVLYLRKEANVFADENIYFSRFSMVEGLKAWTYVPKSAPGKYSKEKVENIEEQNSISRGVFFDDSKRLSFTFPAADEGSKTYMEYTKVYNDPKFLGKFYFQYYIPSLNSEYKITVDKDCEIGYKLFNDPNGEIEFTKEEKGNKIIYTWRMRNTKGFSDVFGDPGIAYHAPHIAVFLKSYTKRNKTTTVLNGPTELYDWYKTLVKDLNSKDDSGLKLITDSIISGVTDTDEKARKIFHWVQDHIKYVAFEDGMAGFIPSEAALVCSKRYGDCKGMSSIITEMLEYAGVEGYLTWVGSRDIPYAYEDIATPIVDNHMIAAYRRDNGEIRFLDAVGSYTPFGYPTSFIQGKQAMVGIGPDSFVLQTVPKVTPNQNLHVDTVILQLKNNRLEGYGTLEAIGYGKYTLTRKLLNKNYKKRVSLLESMLEKGSNKFLIDTAYFTGLDDRDAATFIWYEYNLADYMQAYDDEYYLNMNLDRDLSTNKLDLEKRKGIPMEIDNTTKDIDNVILEIPEGYEVTYVPKNASFQGDDFSFEITYEQKDGKLYFKKVLIIDTLMIEQDQFEEWNEMISALIAAYRETITLKRK